MILQSRNMQDSKDKLLAVYNGEKGKKGKKKTCSVSLKAWRISGNGLGSDSKDHL